MTTKKERRAARYAAQVAALQRQVRELHAQLASTYYFADKELHKAGEPLFGSGVLVTLHALGGREITPPFMIGDGLSADTIAALRADLQRSYKLATRFSPIPTAVEAT